MSLSYVVAEELVRSGWARNTLGIKINQTVDGFGEIQEGF